MPDYRIKHITRYRYTSSVIDSANQVILFPINDDLQIIKSHQLNISFQPDVDIFIDYFGNQVGLFSVVNPHNELTIESNFEVITKEKTLPVDHEDPLKQWQDLANLRDQNPFMDFLMQKNFDAFSEVSAIVNTMKNDSTTPFAFAQAVSSFIFDKFEYKKGITNVETNADQIWQLKAGVCQDFAHIMLVMLRMNGIPSRYVSGYICPKNHELRGEGATHAWAEAYIPSYGWVGLDPTNNCTVSDRHVRLAIGRNFSDCTPVKGTYKGSSEHTLEVSVSIENGLPKKDGSAAVPVFTYQVNNPGIADNSYRRFVEMQQQQ
jgi:transglutaminase-like putative cysteine protease